MKKNILLFICIITILLLFFYIQSNNKYKVYKIESPNIIFLDKNKNLIFDENSPFVLSDVHCIEKDSDLDRYPILKSLSYKEKFFWDYKSKEFAKKSLFNKYVNVKNNKIYLNNKDFSKILIEAKYAFDDNEDTQRQLVNAIKTFNLDEYFIYFPVSKKAFSLDSAYKIKSNNYKIIHVSKLPKSVNKSNLTDRNVDKKIRFIQSDVFDDENLNLFKLDNLKIFFQDLNKIYKPSEKCNSFACLALKNEIDNAKFSIDFAIYGINNQPEIYNALIKAKQRGVKIRGVFDFDKRNINYYPDIEYIKKQIKTINTDEIFEFKNFPAIMHNKFFVFDNSIVWTGSSNISSTDLTEFNANYSLLINSKDVAKIYTSEFNQMYNGKFHTDKISFEKNTVILKNGIKVQILFSPQDNIIDNLIIPIILSAKEYIYIPIFFITHPAIRDALITAHKNGVDIKIINDATNAHSKYSIHKELRKAGIKIKTENYAGKMHMKAMFVDDKISVVGSMNYTKSGNNKNDENVLIIYNKEITKYFKRTFIHLWNKIPDKYEHYDPRAESFESIGSCNDGIDNNFDSKIDSDDIGCMIKN